MHVGRCVVGVLLLVSVILLLGALATKGNYRLCVKPRVGAKVCSLMGFEWRRSETTLGKYHIGAWKAAGLLALLTTLLACVGVLVQAVTERWQTNLCVGIGTALVIALAAFFTVSLVGLLVKDRSDARDAFQRHAKISLHLGYGFALLVVALGLDVAACVTQMVIACRDGKAQAGYTSA